MAHSMAWAAALVVADVLAALKTSLGPPCPTHAHANATSDGAAHGCVAAWSWGVLAVAAYQLLAGAFVARVLCGLAPSARERGGGTRERGGGTREPGGGSPSPITPQRL